MGLLPTGLYLESKSGAGYIARLAVLAIDVVYVFALYYVAVTFREVSSNQTCSDPRKSVPRAFIIKDLRKKCPNLRRKKD